MGVSADVMLRRHDGAPDEKRIHLDPATPMDQVLRAALTKYLQSGSMLVKEASRKPRQTLQFSRGNTAPFGLWTTVDINGESVQQAQGGYILTLCAETASYRYTLSGRSPTVTFGMLLPPGVFVDLLVQDIGSVQFCPTVNTAVLNLEVSEVDS